MNRWIEQNVIFPRINESKQKFRRAEKEKEITQKIIKDLKQEKRKSEYRIIESVHKEKRLSIVSQKKINFSQSKKMKRKPKNVFINKQSSENVNQESRDFLKILQLLQKRREMFHSTPIKKYLKKRKSFQCDRQSFEEIQQMKFEGLARYQQKKSGKKYKAIKIKTQAFEDMLQDKIQPQSLSFFNSVLSVKKARQFDYNDIDKIEQKQGPVKLPQLKKLLKQKRKRDTYLKITSVKGWKIQDDDLKQFFYNQ